MEINWQATSSVPIESNGGHGGIVATKFLSTCVVEEEWKSGGVEFLKRWRIGNLVRREA